MTVIFAPPGGVIEDTPDYTFSYTMSASTGVIILSTTYKPGSTGFNREALQAKAVAAIADLDTAEGLLTGGGAKWDGLTPAQRTAIAIGLVRDMRALIRLAVNRLEASS